MIRKLRILSRGFSETQKITRRELELMKKRGISHLDIKKFTQKRYDPKLGTKQVLETLYYGDLEDRSN